MYEIRFERWIDAPVEDVWQASSDFAHCADYISGISKTEVLTDGPVGMGTRYRETRVMFGKEATEEMEVVAFEPPRRYALQAESHGSRYYSELLFEERDGGTQVTMIFQGTPVTFMAKLVSFLMRPFMKKIMQGCAEDLDDLKRHLEGGGEKAQTVSGAGGEPSGTS